MDKGLLDPSFADRLDQATFLKTAELIKRLEVQEQEKQAKEAAAKTSTKNKAKTEATVEGVTV